MSAPSAHSDLDGYVYLCHNGEKLKMTRSEAADALVVLELALGKANDYAPFLPWARGDE